MEYQDSTNEINYTPSNEGVTRNIDHLNTNGINYTAGSVGNINKELRSNVNHPTNTIMETNTEVQTRTTSNFEARYAATNTGPYSVHVVSTDDKNVAHLHPLKLGKLIHSNKVGNIEIINKLSPNKVDIKFRTFEDANKFIHNSILKEHKLKAFIPANKVLISGVIKGVDRDITIDEIIQETKSPVPIAKAFRFSRKVVTDGEAKYIPTETVKITFLAEQIPQHVYLYHVSFPVEKYKLPLIQCLNCAKFGHKAVICRGETKCFKCSGSHNAKDCNVTTLKCANCGLTHAPNHSMCSVLQTQRRINDIRSDLNITLGEARKAYEGNNQYAKILTNSNNTQTKRSYPTLETPEVQPESTLQYQIPKQKKLSTNTGTSYSTLEHNKTLIYPNGRNESAKTAPLTINKNPTIPQKRQDLHTFTGTMKAISDSQPINQLSHVKEKFKRILQNQYLSPEIKTQIKTLEREIMLVIQRC